MNQNSLGPDTTENEFAGLLKLFRTDHSLHTSFPDNVVKNLTNQVTKLVSGLTPREQDKASSKALMEFGETVKAYKDLFDAQGTAGLLWAELSDSALMAIAENFAHEERGAAIHALPPHTTSAKYILPGSELDYLAYVMALTDFKLGLLSENYRRFADLIGSPAIQEFVVRILFNLIDADDFVVKAFLTSRRMEGYVERLAFVKATLDALLSEKSGTQDRIQIVSVGSANLSGVLSAISGRSMTENEYIRCSVYEANDDAVKAYARIAELYGFAVRHAAAGLVLEKGNATVTIEITEGDKFMVIPHTLKNAGVAIDILEFAGLQEFLPDAINEKMLRRFFEGIGEAAHLIGSGMLAGFEDLNAAYIHGAYHRLFPRTLEQAAGQLQGLPGLDPKNIRLSSAKNKSYYFYVITK